MPDVFHTFEDLEVWKRSRVLHKTLFILLQGNRLHYFRDQILRASLSAMTNIAEGHEAGSRPVLRRYLRIAKGSCGEVRSLLMAGLDMNCYTYGEIADVYRGYKELSRMLTSFIKSIQ